MSASRWERFAPLTGVVFFVLILILFIVDNDTPDADASTADAVSYWTAHDARAITAAILGGFAALFLIWFGGSLRSALLRAEGGEGRLSTLAFAGVLVTGISGAINASIELALGDVADDVPEGVVQTMSVLFAEFYLPFIVGVVIMLFASGLCALRFGGLPRWLAWVGIVIGVITLTPLGFFGFLASLLWVLAVSVLLYLQGGQAPAPTSQSL
jgi:hypothetical protein